MRKSLLYAIIFSVMLTLLLIPSFSSAQTFDALTDVRSALAEAETVDEQLSVLYDASVQFSAVLEREGWEADLNVKPAEELPEDLHPSMETLSAMEKVPLTMEDFDGAKFIAVYNNNDTVYLLGDVQIRLPKENRAASLEEADAVLYLVQRMEGRSDYSGSAYNRVYEFYVFKRGENAYTSAYRDASTPPAWGYGTLRGSTIEMSSLWNGLRPWFYGVIDLTYPEGTASFRIVGESCWLAGLEGEFVRYEVPAEVEGYPVNGIEECINDTLEELVLPEGIEWIGTISGEKINQLNFPSSLRRITGWIKIPGDINLNEGLEEIGQYALDYGRGEHFALPSTLKTVSSLYYGTDSSYLILPEDLKIPSEYFLNNEGNLISIYVPSSVKTLDASIFNRKKSVRIYTPEGSPAAQRSEQNNLDWVACESPEDMPIPYHGSEGDYEYGIAGDEAIIMKYTGSDSLVRIPDHLGGYPVVSMRNFAFRCNSAIRAIILPDTMIRVDDACIDSCTALEALFVPASLTGYSDYWTRWKTIVTTSDAPITADLTENGTEWREWTAEQEAEYEVEPESWDDAQAAALQQVGSVLTFGVYEQDGDENNGPEPVEWIVLAVEEGRSLLISRKALAHEQLNDGTWSTMDYEETNIRKWMVTELWKEMFTPSQWEMVDVHTIQGYLYEWKEKIFLLSVDEADQYFESDEARICMMRSEDGEERPVEWWLRTHGQGGGPYIRFVRNTGYNRTEDGEPFRMKKGIRPAIWVKTGH